MSDDEVTIRAANEIPWRDTEIVFGTRGDAAGCWCQFYKITNAQWREGDKAQRASELCEQVRNAAVTPGLVAYVGDEPVGWVAVEPRPHYPTALRGRVISTGSRERVGDESVWAIVCFVVRVGYRRRGLALHLLRAAVEHAWANGARMIEGYPVEVAENQRMSSAGLYHGTVSLFSAAGFTIDSRPIAGRALMTLHS
ncbi:MAG TPA: GNAT family N-acetyltransferase [Galbitalea sp.]|jgi:GNAT superfamily N-acetyltransferase|nr:GNAT family N-acetyltransferase [Galbitalea sp.]